MSKKKNNPQNPYFVDKFAQIPARTKITFLKFWLSGASFYVTVNGLPERFDLLDRIVLMTLILILGVEYISNPIILWMHQDQSDTKRYLPHLIKRKSIFSLLATALYVIIMVVMTMMFLDLWVSWRLPTIGDIISQSTADPFSFALIFLMFDALWLFGRRHVTKRLEEKRHPHV
ncbi:MAG: hypothetical protein K9K93_07760 [Acholeplasmataceae bacterium]|nr:hypothetical protein [Acholeplasmataceae bacterium]